MTNRFCVLEQPDVDFGDMLRDVASQSRGTWSSEGYPLPDALLPTQPAREPSSGIGRAKRRITSEEDPYAYVFVQMLQAEAEVPQASVGFGGTTLDELSRWIQEAKKIAHGSLEHALEQLREVHEDAAEEGLPEPSQKAIATAEQLLRLTYQEFPDHEVSVYPDDDGSVCIYAPGGKRWSFLMICAPSGGILCSANRPQRPWQIRFSGHRDARRSGLLLKALHDNELGAPVP